MLRLMLVDVGLGLLWFLLIRFVTPQNTLKSFLNIIRVYYKCILKLFVITILLSEKISKPGICTRYKGKSGICQNRI